MQAFAKAVHASSNSKHQLEVAQVLTDLGVKHTTNYLTNDGLFCADIMVQDHHVIIQVDEVHHWTVNTGQPIGKQNQPLEVGFLAFTHEGCHTLCLSCESLIMHWREFCRSHVVLMTNSMQLQQ